MLAVIHVAHALPRHMLATGTLPWRFRPCRRRQLWLPQPAWPVAAHIARLKDLHRFSAVLTEARTSSFTVRPHSICTLVIRRSSIAVSLDITACSLRPCHGATVTGSSPLFFCNTSIQQHNTHPLNSGKNLYCLRRLARPDAQNRGSAGTPSERRRNAVGSPLERSNDRAKAQKKERRSERSSLPQRLPFGGRLVGPRSRSAGLAGLARVFLRW